MMFQYPRYTWVVVKIFLNGENCYGVLVPTIYVGCSGCSKIIWKITDSSFSTHDIRGLQQRNLHKSSFFMLLFYHNVLHLSSAFSNKFQIFHHFFLLYLFFFRFSGANLPFSPFKQMRKSGLSRNYFSILLLNIKYYYSNFNFFSLIISCIVVLPVLWVCLVAFFRMFSCAFWKSFSEMIAGMPLGI